MNTAPPSAPPDGVSGSEQALESRIWRLQLDLASGGLRSLLFRGGPVRELIDPEALPHPFQLVARGSAGQTAELARFSRGRLRFNQAGAELAAELVLAAGRWNLRFRVNADDALLRVEVVPQGLPEQTAEMGLPLGGAAWVAGAENWMRREAGDFQLVVLGSGLVCLPERGSVELGQNPPARLVLGVVPPGEAAAAAWVRENRG
ncbi:MAG: hypothetical protein R6X19_00980 [Kiritimatiellia bacterium]